MNASIHSCNCRLQMFKPVLKIVPMHFLSLSHSNYILRLVAHTAIMPWP